MDYLEIADSRSQSLNDEIQSNASLTSQHTTYGSDDTSGAQSTSQGLHKYVPESRNSYLYVSLNTTANNGYTDSVTIAKHDSFCADYVQSFS